MEPIKYLHISDLHLGKRQYNLQQRYEDYFRAFNWILKLAIKENVDFLLISGDIFDNKNINPSVLSDVYHTIIEFNRKCQKSLNHDIPLICIEGNHDNPIYTVHSWMSFLADLDLIILLAGEYDKETKEVIFKPYSSSIKRGGKVEIKDTVIYGIPYYGSFTRHLFPAISDAIEETESKFKIILMHFGIEGQDNIKPGIELNPSLVKLHEKVDYLGLGHFHKQYTLPEEDPWIFNPGSLEMNDLGEYQYERGAFLVEVSGKEYYNKKITTIDCDNGNRDPNKLPNREFVRITSIDISGSSSFENAINDVLKKIKKWGVPERVKGETLDLSDLNYPIISLNLVGEIGFSKLEININKLREQIKSKFQVLDVRIFAKDLFSSLDDIKLEDSNLTIEEIEKEVFSSLIIKNPEYGKHKDQILGFLFDIKSELLSSSPNYVKLKERFGEWCKLNVEGFMPLKLNIEDIDKPSIESRNKLKETKKVKKKKVEEEILEEKSDQKALDERDEELEFGFYDEFDDLDDSIDDGDDLNGGV